MTRLVIDILDEGDKGLIMKQLEELRGKHWIQYNRFGAAGLPGSPMSVEELNEMIDDAEDSPSLSAESFKARFGL